MDAAEVIKGAVAVRDRTPLEFVIHVRKSFAFLNAMGFVEVEALPTLVRYQKGNVTVNVYHGRLSYEIGAETVLFGTSYSISEIIKHVKPELVGRFRHMSARTSKDVAARLEGLGELVKSYCLLALDGDPKLVSALQIGRKLWAEEYAMDVLARQTRTKAAEAFRNKNYEKAAELYSQIKERLSPAELKKLSIAEARRNT